MRARKMKITENNLRKIIREEIKSLTEASMDDRDYDKAVKQLRPVIGILWNPVGPGAIDQVHDAARSLNSAVKDLVLDITDSRGFNRSQVEKAFEESGLSGRDFVKQLKQFKRKAI